MEVWHWSIEIWQGDRIAINETGDTWDPNAAWIRVGDALRRRGDDIAMACMDPLHGQYGHRQGNNTANPLRVICRVSHVP